MNKIFHWFTEAIIAYALKRPWVHIEGYMERFWVVPYSRWRWLPTARIHHILRSDADRVFHDHPWDYITVILREGYTEVTPHWDASGLYLGERRERIHPGRVLFRRATHWHRLEVEEGKTAWTLFITFRWKQKWGFLISPAHKMRYEEYLTRATLIEEADPNESRA